MASGIDPYTSGGYQFSIRHENNHRSFDLYWLKHGTTSGMDFLGTFSTIRQAEEKARDAARLYLKKGLRQKKVQAVHGKDPRFTTSKRSLPGMSVAKAPLPRVRTVPRVRLRDDEEE